MTPKKEHGYLKSRIEFYRTPGRKKYQSTHQLFHLLHQGSHHYKKFVFCTGVMKYLTVKFFAYFMDEHKAWTFNRLRDKNSLDGKRHPVPCHVPYSQWV